MHKGWTRSEHMNITNRWLVQCAGFGELKNTDIWHTCISPALVFVTCSIPAGKKMWMNVFALQAHSVVFNLKILCGPPGCPKQVCLFLPGDLIHLEGQFINLFIKRWGLLWLRHKITLFFWALSLRNCLVGSEQGLINIYISILPWSSNVVETCSI